MKSVFITGGARGIGGAIANKFASVGYKTIILSRTLNELESKSNELNTKWPNKDFKHEYIQFDLSEINKLCELNKNGLFTNSDILINCAGITQNKLLINEEEENISKILNVNLHAPIILSKYFIKNAMRNKRKKGNRETDKPADKPAVVNISSVLAHEPCNGVGASVYTSSKAGLTAFSKALNTEMGGRVKVCSAEPSLVENTAIGATVDPAQHTRHTTAERVADHVHALARDLE